MEENDSFALKAYQELTGLDASGRAVLVRNIYNNKLYVKKRISSYDLSVFRYLRENPVRGMPGIVELVEDDGGLIVIEEYISGDTLREKLEERGTLPENEAREIMAGLCRILKGLHPSIIHRDIKPDNIIILPNGSVMLLDVNAAKWYTPDKERDTRLIGTTGYAAPEQYGFAGSDVRTDIYAMGVLFNVMLTGKTPQEHMAEGDSGRIIRKCTQLDPADRYPDADSLLEDISGAGPQQDKDREYRYRWQRFLPPGFRSLRIERMVGALAGYALAFTLIFDLTLRNKDGQYNSRVFNGGLAIVFVLLVLLWSDYLDLQKYLPVINSKKPMIKGLGIIAYSVAITVIGLLSAIILM